jgi:hypothetical protein
LSNLDGVLSAVCAASYATPEDFEDLPPSEALTIALDVRPMTVAVEAALLDEDVEFLDDVELVEEEPSDALTVARHLEVEPVAAFASPAPALVDLPEEACTRPEPVVLRRALRPALARELAPPAQEALPRTPTLGSLAAELPVLAPELIAEMTRRELSAAASAASTASAAVETNLEAEPRPEPSVPSGELEEWVVCSAPSEDCTEPMPDVVPLSPGVAIVASRQSEVSELLADFQVAEDNTHQGLRRAIKELAELDLTPAPFAALIR